MSELIINNLVKSYNGRVVVNSVCFCVKGGEVVGLLGPNGAGKTTTFYMIIGLLKPDHGIVYLNGIDLAAYPTHIRARKGMGYLPQESSVFKKLTVEQNLMIILESLPFTYRERKSKAYKLLDELSIFKFADSYASVLSGGERRRLEIARALVTDPKVILLDEPFAGVDPMAIVDITNIIRYLKTKGIGVLISDHNVRETLGVCDKAFILSEGKVVESGSPEKIVRSDIARKFYLGNKFKF